MPLTRTPGRILPDIRTLIWDPLYHISYIIEGPTRVSNLLSLIVPLGLSNTGWEPPSVIPTSIIYTIGLPYTSKHPRSLDTVSLVMHLCTLLTDLLRVCNHLHFVFSLRIPSLRHACVLEVGLWSPSAKSMTQTLLLNEEPWCLVCWAMQPKVSMGLTTIHKRCALKLVLKHWFIFLYKSPLAHSRNGLCHMCMWR
jgi:hypothetical protein